VHRGSGDEQGALDGDPRVVSRCAVTLGSSSVLYVVYPSPWCNAFDGVSSCGVAVGTLLSTGKILGFGNES
jgi:hypothetical protein